MKYKQCLDGKCDYCGKETLENEDLVDDIIVLKKSIQSSPFDVVLGEWCSEKCFVRGPGKAE